MSSLTNEERVLAELALRGTSGSIPTWSTPEHEMLVARAAVHLSARILRGEFTLPDHVSKDEQSITDYLISCIRMTLDS